ncbi:MAG TPA: RNA polymerase sigma factor [Ktedonobacteraceae bacterium]|nr:RNA polymerase sigma factor [Ktedonobacteraceae bacterium]
MMDYALLLMEGQDQEAATTTLPERPNGTNRLENDTPWVISACQGSMAAFEELVRRYEPRIRRMLYGLTQDIQLTQDLCQETFLAAFRALPRMDGAQLRFAPWLYRIALNQIRSEWRRRKHVSVVSFLSLTRAFEDDFADEGAISALVCPAQFEDSIAEQDVVRQVLAQLPRSSAMCLLLDAEGFSYREIAEILQDSLSAVRSRLSRARHTFRHLYNSIDQGEVHEKGLPLGSTLEQSSAVASMYSATANAAI